MSERDARSQLHLAGRQGLLEQRVRRSAVGITQRIGGERASAEDVVHLADVGPVEINKNENHTVDWPTYAAGVAVVAGIVVLLIDRRKT